MRRVFWTLGMAIIGLFLGLKGQGPSFDAREIATATVWAAAIGFGFGTIFDQRRPRKRLVIYWATTLALVAAFFGPLLPLTSFLAQETSASIIGGLAGVLIGSAHLKKARRAAEGSDLAS